MFYEVQKCHLMQDLEYLIEILRFCDQNSTRGCGGCNPLEGIDCYALKCTKITLFARIYVFYNNTSILFVCIGMAGGVGYSPWPP